MGYGFSVMSFMQRQNFLSLTFNFTTSLKGKNKKIFQKEDHKLTISKNKKMASDLHRTAQPRTLAMFPSWGSLQELVV